MNYEIFPKIREDINIQVLEYENDKMLLLTDPTFIAEDDILVPTGMFPLFNYLDGNTKYEDVRQELLSSTENAEEILKAVCNVVDNLDEYCYLYTDNYFDKKAEIDKYLALDIRPPVLAGFSYPDNKKGYIEALDFILNCYDYEPKTKNAKAIIAPHIDFTIGDSALNSYSAVYKTVEESDADTFVIFGTSHYNSSAPFMLTNKEYTSPEGVIHTDFELLSLLKSKLNNDLYLNDIAHKDEHSIEFHACLLQRKFAGKDIKILPVLCGSITELLLMNTDPNSKPDYSDFFKALKESISELGRKVCFIASGDSAHIGERHNSRIIDALSSLNDLEKEDKKLAEIIGKNNKPEFIKHFFENMDIWQVCGAAPFYAVMNACDYSDYEQAYYGIWQEHELNAAVSFISLGLV